MKKIVSIFLVIAVAFSFFSKTMMSTKIFAATNYESEDNNSYSSANTMQLNSSMKGSIGYGTFSNDSDVDWYKITTVKAGVLSIKFAHVVDTSSVASWNVAVYKIEDYDQLLLTKEAQVRASENSISLPSLGLDAGTYYICVANNQYTSGIEYSITNTFIESSNWETEFNDTYSTADIFNINSSIEGCIRQGTYANSSDGDSDYYRIVLPASGRLSLTVSHTTENGESYAKWYVCFYKYYNGSYIELFDGQVGTLDNPYTFPTLSVEEGTYYVLLKNNQYTKGVNYKIMNVFECNHSYNTSVTKLPTCTEMGIKTYTCSSCGKSYTETIPALGHTYDNGVITNSPSCTTTGTKMYTCSSCGNSHTETLPALSHTYDNGVITNSPSCTTTGIKTYTCSSCGKSYTETLPALSHTYDNGVITNSPSCTTAGTKTYTCIYCNSIYTESIPMIEHAYYVSEYVQATCDSKGYQVNTCLMCSNSYMSNFTSALGHNMAWTIDREPTYSAVGYKHKECTKCGYITNMNTIINKIEEGTSIQEGNNSIIKYITPVIYKPSIKLKNIKGKKVKLTLSKPKYSYNGKISANTKYEIMYAQNKKFTKGKKVKKYKGTLKTSSKAIIGFKKKKTYYFKCRVVIKYWDIKYNSWKYRYSTWSDVKKSKITK